MKKLLKNQIACKTGVEICHTQPYYTKKYGNISLPKTEEANNSTILIPLYPSMTQEEQEYVIKNLKEAVKGEEFEYKNMYTKFITQVEEEDQKAALSSFKNAMTVEQTHYSLSISPFEAVQSGKNVEGSKIFGGRVRGYQNTDQTPQQQPMRLWLWR